jgi:hypothetical protein
MLVRDTGIELVAHFYSRTRGGAPPWWATVLADDDATLLTCSSFAGRPSESTVQTGVNH